jgi:hypothetical protein
VRQHGAILAAHDRSAGTKNCIATSATAMGFDAHSSVERNAAGTCATIFFGRCDQCGDESINQERMMIHIWLRRITLCWWSGCGIDYDCAGKFWQCPHCGRRIYD